jgi:CelD/BcsL family acetyltransferase involved in cellulose biosynthesis
LTSKAATLNPADSTGWPPSHEILEAWRALAVERENVFISPEWYGVWLAHNPHERPLTLVCRDEHDGVAGVLPLVVSRRGPARILRFAGAAIGDWFGPACSRADEPAVAAACAAALESLSADWHVVGLDRLERDRAWPQRLAAAWPRGDLLVAPWHEGDVLPYVEIGPGGFAGYLAGRSRHFRSHLRRDRRRLEERHSVRFRMTEAEPDLDRDLTTLFRLHHGRWESRGGSTLRGSGERFHRAFARVALARGWLRLWTLELDGSPVAAWYGWRVGARYCYSFGGFDPAYADERVGFLLVAHTIERAAEEGSAVYDMLWGDEPYKRRFETGRRHADSVLLTRRGHPASALVSGVSWSRSCVRRLPQPLRKQLKAAYRGAREGGRAARSATREANGG